MLDDTAAKIVMETASGAAFTELMFQKVERDVCRQLRVFRALMGEVEGCGAPEGESNPSAPPPGRLPGGGDLYAET